MPFIYLPTVKVQPYRLFGVVLYAVESTGADFETGELVQLQHLYTHCEIEANHYADLIISGED